MRVLALILLLPLIGNCQDWNWEDQIVPIPNFTPPAKLVIDSSFYLPSDSIPYVDTLSQIDFDTAFWYYLGADTIIPIDTIFGRVLFLIKGGYVRWDNGYWYNYIYHSYRWGEIKSEDVLYFIQKP